MTLRYTLSHLSRPPARRAFGRTWLGVCVTGALISLLAFGARHVFFIATIWLVCVFAPVRIAVEVLHTLGPRFREQLRQDLARRDDRYATREDLMLMAETLFRREVRLPRLAPPDLGAKVIEATVGVCGRAFGAGEGPLGVLRAATACAALLERWVGAIVAGEDTPLAVHPVPLAPTAPATTGNGAAPPGLWDAHASIQEHWITLRAVAGMAALAKTLTAVYEDSSGASLDGGDALRAEADAAMDYADQIGLRLEGPAWEDVPGVPRAALPQELIARLAETWTAFCAAPQPAPRRLLTFLHHVPE